MDNTVSRVEVEDTWSLLYVGPYRFYYGHDERTESGEWLFTVEKEPLNEPIFTKTAKELGKTKFESHYSTGEVLLAGIGAFIQSKIRGNVKK